MAHFDQLDPATIATWTLAAVLGILGVMLVRMHMQSAARAQRLPGAMTSDLTPKDREFLPAAIELLETPASPVRIAGIWLICAMFAAALTWAYYGRLDIHAIAQGRIQPSGRSKTIQPLDPGKVHAIKVENGSHVQAGDVLIELDPTDTGADRESQTRDLESARGESARRRTAVAIARSDVALKPQPITFDAAVSAAVQQREEAVLTADLNQLKANVASLEAQLTEHEATSSKLRSSIKAREKSLALAKERVDMRSGLNTRGSLSRAMVIEVLSQYETLVTQQVSEQGQLVETDAGVETTRRKMEEAATQFVADQTSKLAESERKADKITQDLVKATAKNDRTSLKAPITGTVQQLIVTTVGQVVGSGQSVMTIVPSDGPIEIEAMVLNQDIGFVEAGQEAVIKVEAFPFTRFGTLNGTIVKISRDAVEEREAMADPATAGRNGGGGATSGGKGQSYVFPATVRLNRSSMLVEGKEVALSPGMTVTVEILTGQRRAIDYVLSPLREVAASSGRER